MKEEYIKIGLISLASLWAFFRSTEWYMNLIQEIKGNKLEFIYRILESAVVQTYYDYVKGIKKLNRKLSPIEASSAMKKTLRDAQDILKPAGIKMSRYLVPGEAEAFIEKTIQELKRGE